METLKIAQFINNLETADGGPSRNSFELNISLNQIPGTEANLYSIHGGPENSVLKAYAGEAGPIPRPGPRWLALKSNSRRRLISPYDIYEDIRVSDLVIIHGYYLPWIPIVASLCVALKVPFAITPHGSLTQHQQKSSKIKKLLFDATLARVVKNHAAGFVTGSPIEKQDLEDKFPWATVYVGGVGTSIPKNINRTNTWHQPTTLLSMSRIAPKKRIDISIRAVRVLIDRGYDCRLIVAGTGNKETKRKLQNLVNSLGIENQVSFVGQVSGPAKADTFATSDIFLLPSEDENFGIGLAEALAHGLPVVASEAVASARFVSESVGRVIPSPSESEIAEAVISITRNSKSQYTSEARKCVRRHYSWVSTAENWIQIARRLTAKSSA